MNSEPESPLVLKRSNAMNWDQFIEDNLIEKEPLSPTISQKSSSTYKGKLSLSINATGLTPEVRSNLNQNEPSAESKPFEELGDKKEKFQAQTIIFTCYGPEAIEDPPKWLSQWIPGQCNWILAQKEKCPKTGKLHLQGMAYSKQKISWTFFTKTGVWKRRCLFPDESIKYCTKKKTSVDGPWEFGDRPKFSHQARGEEMQKQRKEKKAEQNAMILKRPLSQLIEEGELEWKDYANAKKFKTMYICDEKIAHQLSQPIDHQMDHYWCVGGTGTGKTTWARTTFPDHYLKTKNKWWDEYMGQETVILEDIGKTDALYLGDRLKEWADKWSFRGEIKGGMVNIRPKRIVVTSNYRIEELWDDNNIVEPLLRRFNIKEF